LIPGSKTQVTLDLYKVEEWHFKTEYYLDVYVEGNPEPFREAASLIRCKYRSHFKN
jgi:hypothetical protein